MRHSLIQEAHKNAHAHACGHTVNMQPKFLFYQSGSGKDMQMETVLAPTLLGDFKRFLTYREEVRGRELC